MSLNYLHDQLCHSEWKIHSDCSSEIHHTHTSSRRPSNILQTRFGLCHDRFQFKSAVETLGETLKRGFTSTRVADGLFIQSPKLSLSTNRLLSPPRLKTHDIPNKGQARINAGLEGSPTFPTRLHQSTACGSPPDDFLPGYISSVFSSPQTQPTTYINATQTQGSFGIDIVVGKTPLPYTEETWIIAHPTQEVIDQTITNHTNCHIIDLISEGPQSPVPYNASLQPTNHASTSTPDIHNTNRPYKQQLPIQPSLCSLYNLLNKAPQYSPLSTTPKLEIHKLNSTAVGIAPLQENLINNPEIGELLKKQKLCHNKHSKFCSYYPKRPNVFDGTQGLSLSIVQERYKCCICGKSYKNKNDARRHQYSIHIRQYSWSCSALTDYHCAFYRSRNRPQEADVCGFCGKEFSRSGLQDRTGATSGNILEVQTADQGIKGRKKHLEEVHMFKSCKVSKKFYRADHFRQHLKHSHSSYIGEWISRLENACLRKER